MLLNPSQITEFWQRLNLKGRILGGYSIPVILSIISAVLVYIQGVQQVQRHSQDVADLHTQVNDVKNLALSIAAMQQTARGYLLGENSEALQEYEEWDTRFYKQSEKLRGEIADPSQLKILNEIITLGDRLNEFNRRLISYVVLGKPRKAKLAWERGEVQQLASSLNLLVQKFEAIEYQKLAEHQQEQADSLQYLTVAVFGLAGISALLSSGLGNAIASAISQHLSRETTTIAASAIEIAATMVEQERITSVTATAVDRVTAQIDELNVTFQKATTQAKTSAIEAELALDLSDRGTQAVNRTLVGMSDLKEKVRAIAQQSSRLNEKSLQIDTIARLVRELANQTNMLALNATIEAVRAGNNQGFEVVAKEIRQLAQESKQSAQNIKALIADIQNAIQTTVLAAEEGTATVDEGVKIARETATAFAGVAEIISKLAANNQHISLDADRQADALQQVTEAMISINQASQENSQGIAQVRVGTERLNEALQNLKALI